MTNDARIKLKPFIQNLIKEHVDAAIAAETERQKQMVVIHKILSLAFEPYRLGQYGFDSVNNEFTRNEPNEDDAVD